MDNKVITIMFREIDKNSTWITNIADIIVSYNKCYMTIHKTKTNEYLTITGYYQDVIYCTNILENIISDIIIETRDYNAKDFANYTKGINEALAYKYANMNIKKYDISVEVKEQLNSMRNGNEVFDYEDCPLNSYDDGYENGFTFVSCLSE